MKILCTTKPYAFASLQCLCFLSFLPSFHCMVWIADLIWMSHSLRRRSVIHEQNGKENKLFLFDCRANYITQNNIINFFSETLRNFLICPGQIFPVTRQNNHFLFWLHDVFVLDTWGMFCSSNYTNQGTRFSSLFYHSFLSFVLVLYLW